MGGREEGEERGVGCRRGREEGGREEREREKEEDEDVEERKDQDART